MSRKTRPSTETEASAKVASPAVSRVSAPRSSLPSREGGRSAGELVRASPGAHPRSGPDHPLCRSEGRVLPPQGLARESVAQPLHELHDDDDDEHDDRRDRPVVLLVPVHDREVPETARPEITADSGHVEHADEQKRVAEDERSEHYG